MNTRVSVPQPPLWSYPYHRPLPPGRWRVSSRHGGNPTHELVRPAWLPQGEMTHPKHGSHYYHCHYGSYDYYDYYGCYVCSYSPFASVAPRPIQPPPSGSWGMSSQAKSRVLRPVTVLVDAGPCQAKLDSKAATPGDAKIDPRSPT